MTVIQKLTARVFGGSQGVGGNPLTIFHGKIGGAEGMRKLAQTCDWESVFVEDYPNNKHCKFRFFLPSGDEVSFCAHAAIGACFHIHASSRERSGQVEFQTMGAPSQRAQIKDDFVGLGMSSLYTETLVPETVISSLLQQIKVDPSHVLTTSVNACIARPKTLVQLPLEVLTEAKNPTDPELFRDTCDEARESTGLYLYAASGAEWECRQFPRFSGYPEDPATGIAAGALAVYLYNQGVQRDVYSIRQGTTMKRPSLISVQNIQIDRTTNQVDFECGGRVEIDDMCKIEV